MSQARAASLRSIETAAPSGAVIMGVVRRVPGNSAAEELSLLQANTEEATVLMAGFRNRISENPTADLKTAFDHVEAALAHSRALNALVDATDEDDQKLLHLSMQYFQAVLSDIPQVSFLDNRMIAAYYAIKDALVETRQMLEL